MELNRELPLHGGDDLTLTLTWRSSSERYLLIKQFVLVST